MKEIDKRNHASFTDLASRRASFEAIAASNNLSLTADSAESSTDINSWTGNPRSIKPNAPVSLPGTLVERAVSFVQSQKATFGFEEGSTPEYFPDASISSTQSGLPVVHLQQTYKGIPIFLVNRKVIFNKEGKIIEAGGDSVDLTQEIDISPKVPVTEALQKVIAYIQSERAAATEKVDGWGETVRVEAEEQVSLPIRKLVEFPKITCRPTVLDKGYFQDLVPAHLVIFYKGPDAVLAWYFIVKLRETGEQCDFVVAADNAEGALLYVKEISNHVLAKGNVHRLNGGENRQWVDFPLNRTAYPLPQNGGSTAFSDWVNGDETRGTNVIAISGDSMESLKGLLDSNPIQFDPNTEQEQQLLNVFYFCNFLHDFFYLLGFNEQAGSFEGNDPLEARTYNRPVMGTANMETPIDGSSPLMNMGILQSTGRHTALDADVVFHEYVHGVTNRLVGGRMNDRALIEPQSRGMGEGWSDYFALTIQNFNLPPGQEKVVTGSWVKDSPAGIRSHPYDDSFADHLTYAGLRNLSGEHRIGELWCATLMHWTRHLSTRIGQASAYFICWQSVVDGLKLTNANPSFLEARDAILLALAGLRDAGIISEQLYAAARQECGRSFARFGMGLHAKSNGPWLDGITEDFTVIV